jgi:hypothetical protein
MMSDGDVVFSNASVSSRHHTLLMENLPSWNKFPKRSKSIIGKIGYQKYMFGKHSYFVIPLMVLLWVDSMFDLWTTWIEPTKFSKRLFSTKGVDALFLR